MAKTLIHLLKERSEKAPQDALYSEVCEEGQVQRTLTAQELYVTAQKISTFIQPTERVLILYPSGLKFIEAFFGVLAGRGVVVAGHVLHASVLKRQESRLKGIIQNAQIKKILTTQTLAEYINSFMPDFVEVLVHEQVVLAVPGSSGMPQEQDLALIQYTSGTLSAPKGVPLTYGNILSNVERICRVAQLDRCRLLSWLPHSHDMGLIGGICVPLVAQGEGFVMDTAAFLKSPLSWLKALSRLKCTTSPAPNFAYEMCLREMKRAPQDVGDLSSVRVLFDGAEVVRASTITEFTAIFENFGLHSESLYPCYGLAEATLMVSGAAKRRRPQILQWKHESLISCGPVIPDHEVRIWDDSKRVFLSEGGVGEICIRGPSVFSKYWNDSERTAKSFLRLFEAGEEKAFFRTGDEGFLRDSEIFVLGRIDDVLVVRGEKIHPEDLEAIVAGVDVSLRPQGCAAFQDKQEIIIAVEIEDLSSEERDILKTRMAKEILWKLGLPCQILFLQRGALPKTTSGKVQRSLCREMHQKNLLKVFG